jgi:integrase
VDVIAGEQRLTESMAETASREVKEEAGGLLVKVGDKIGERVHPKTGRTMVYMAATPTHGTDIDVGDREELAAVEWASLAEADERMPDMYGPVHDYLEGMLGGEGNEPAGAKQPPDGRWAARHSAPAGPDGKRPQPRVYGRTKKECTEVLVAALGQVHAGRPVDDRRTKCGGHLDRRLRWWESEHEIKPSTLDSYREIVELYLRPAWGHMKISDLRDHHFRDLAAALRKINRPEADADSSDLMRRLLAARATRDGLRYSTRPLTDARIKRVMAVASSSLADLVPHVLAVNPAAAVKVGKGRKVKPLLWTGPRTERWRETGQVPGRVMVWSREQCGAFLDGIEDERLYSLYHVAGYFGLRRSEHVGLCWADVDLAARRVHVRQAQVDDELDSTKSEDSDRVVVIDEGTAEVLKAWRKAQLAERLAWAGVWTDSGRVFTREDGTPPRPGWVSARFDTLAERAGLPPITLHGLRHGAATMLLAAGQPPKVISEVLGHSTVAFTMDIYTEVAEELADAAAAAIAAFIPRRAKTVPNRGADDR